MNQQTECPPAELWAGAQEISEYGATLRCSVCSIFLGPGHVEDLPTPLPGSPAPFCGPCARSTWRGMVAAER